MDKEKNRKEFLETLETYKKEFNIPQEDLDKAILDYDLIANDMNDVKALQRFSEQLIEGILYKNNIDFDNKTINPDGSITEKSPGMIVNKDVPIEDFKLLFSGSPKDYKMPDILDDLKDTEEYSRARFQLWSFEQEYQDRQKFKKLINQQYEIFYEYLKENPDLPIEDKKILLDELRTRTLIFDERYKEMTVKNDVDLSLQELETFDNLIAHDAQNLKNDILPNMLTDAKLKELDINTPDTETMLEQMDNQETSNADLPNTESEDGVRLEGELVDEKTEFDQIIDNEQRTNWWRYDNSSDEFADYMERYTSGDLTDEELADLKEQHEEFKNGSEAYDADVEEVANKAGITDTKAFKMLIQAGTKILQAIDEELIYSPLLLAEKGLNKLGLGVAGKATGGLTRLALAYEDLLFKANVGIAGLAHGSLGMQGTASRLPYDIANGILGLYGAGMPEQIVPEVEGGMSKEEQAKRHQTMFANQMYQYSRMSPSFRLFTDVIGPKTGITDPIQGWKNFGKMLGGNE